MSQRSRCLQASHLMRPDQRGRAGAEPWPAPPSPLPLLRAGHSLHVTCLSASPQLPIETSCACVDAATKAKVCSFPWLHQVHHASSTPGKWPLAPVAAERGGLRYSCSTSPMYDIGPWRRSPILRCTAGGMQVRALSFVGHLCWLPEATNPPSQARSILVQHIARHCEHGCACWH